MQAKLIPDSEAQRFWDNSEAGPLFCNPAFLKTMNHEVAYFGAYKSEELLVVWPIISGPGKSVVGRRPAFSYYFGPYMKESFAAMRPYKAYRVFLDGISAMLPLVTVDFQHLEFSLAPEFNDLRPFLWWKYGEEREQNFHYNPRYSARINPTLFVNQDDLLKSFRLDDKRKKARRIIAEGRIVTRFESEVEDSALLSIYEQTLKRSGGMVRQEELESLSLFLSMSRNSSTDGSGFKLILGTEFETSSVLGFQLLFLGKNRCYAVAQGSTDLGRQMDVGVLLSLESILHAKKSKCVVFDFQGANSPQRADDKHAFGAIATNYSDLEFS